MKLKAVIDDHERDLVITLKDKNVVAEVNGRGYQLQLSGSENSNYLLFNGTQVYECAVSPRSSGFDVTIRGKTYRINLIDPRRLRIDEDSDRHQHGTAEIIAQMPGKVVRVLAQAGQQISAGEGIMVVEAMKMQNEMKSPRPGVVVSINVQAGDTVEAGAILALID
jgi:biotin carboxyl carrier protein